MKERGVPLKLQGYRALRPRMDFSESEESYYLYLEKGYEGECRFDKWAVPLQENMIFLNDISLEFNNSDCQIDSLGISSKTIYIFEVKNFEGDYAIREGKWYSPKGNVIKNPLLQLERAETIVNYLLKEHGFRFSIQPYLIFNNPEFHLFDAPSHLPIIYSPQLNRFNERLYQNCKTAGNKENFLAEKLLSLHKEELSSNHLPAYRYDDLRKGIVCPGCLEFYGGLQTNFHCNNCKRRESCKEAVLRSVKEFKLLFPERKVTTNQVYDWCGVVKDVRTIQRILKANFTLKGFGVSSFYE